MIQYFTKRALSNFMTPFQKFMSNQSIQVNQFLSLIDSKARSLLELRNKGVSVPQIISETMWETFNNTKVKVIGTTMLD